MYQNQKIGVGLLTCNRKNFFSKQLSAVTYAKQLNIVDDIVVVKNLEYDYSDLHLDKNEQITYHNVQADIGIGYCKNVALKSLLNSGCDHFFLIEDDIKIKDINVFEKYIDTAKAFKLEHLIFGAVYTPPSWKIDNIVNTAILQKNGLQLDMYANLHGGFVYFTKKCIQYCGLFDEQYINAVEHIDHTYRIINFGFYTPFWAFADIHDSIRYLEDTQPENPSTINNNQLKEYRTIAGFNRFFKTWNLQVSHIPHPTKEQINSYLIWRQQHA